MRRNSRRRPESPARTRLRGRAYTHDMHTRRPSRAGYPHALACALGIVLVLALPFPVRGEGPTQADELRLEREQNQQRHWLSLEQQEYRENNLPASPAGRFAQELPLESQRREQDALYDRQVRELRLQPPTPSMPPDAAGPPTGLPLQQRQGLERRMLDLYQSGQRQDWSTMRPDRRR